MSAKAFVDTNILVYAHDNTIPDKQKVASKLLDEIWQDRNGILSVQVLQEFYVALSRRVAKPLEPKLLAEVIQDYLHWEIVVNDAASVVGAIDIQQRYQLSFWDALIIHAANRSRADILYSEDLNHEQVYGAVQVINPFLLG